jgi:transposase InsO family protein
MPACSRVTGWAIADHMRTDLVEDAPKMAIALRGELPVKVVFHSDRGTRYASAQITLFAANNGITRSMGHTAIFGTTRRRKCPSPP